MTEQEINEIITELINKCETEEELIDVKMTINDSLDIAFETRMCDFR